MLFRQLSFTLLTLTMIFSAVRLAAQEADQPIISSAAGVKFAAIPNAPACFTIAVEKGDPTKGSSVILAKFAPGCVAPFHWHTRGETAMVVSGSLETQMQGDKSSGRASRRFPLPPFASRAPRHLPGISRLPRLSDLRCGLRHSLGGR